MLRDHEALALDFIRQTIKERRENPHSLSMHVTVGDVTESITTTVFKITPRWDALLAIDEEKEMKGSGFADKHIDDLLATFPMYSGPFLVEVMQFLGAIKRNGLFLGRKDDLFYFNDEEYAVALWYTDDQKSADIFASLDRTVH